MDMTPPLKIADLLEIFRGRQERHQAAKFHSLEVGLVRMREALNVLQQRAEEEEFLIASRFNIFSLLGVESNEVATHSRLLGELLSPKGTHAQGALFLEMFLNLLASLDEEFPAPDPPFIHDQWRVERERHTNFGNIDIVISSQAAGYLVVIENKVWSTEQGRQLERYADWMKIFKAEYPQQVLIYLTPGGWESDTANQAKYLPLSYHEDIVSWLESCLPQIQAQRVTETLRQYLDVIKKL